MPYYEYHCSANGRTVEVRHPMSERLETWGQVAALAGAGADDTPADAPVDRLLSAPVPITGAGAGTGGQGCGSGCACFPEA